MSSFQSTEVRGDRVRAIAPQGPSVPTGGVIVFAEETLTDGFHPAIFRRLGGEPVFATSVQEVAEEVCRRFAMLVLVPATLESARFRLLVAGLLVVPSPPLIVVFGRAASAALGAELLAIGGDAWLDIQAPDEIVVAQSRALIRRHQAPLVPLSAYDLNLDPIARTVRHSDRQIWLAPKEFHVLHLLLTHCDQVVTVAEIARVVWKHEHPQSHDTYRHVIHSLRKKLEQCEAPRLLHTVWGSGYRLGAL
jgi:DNA-binding response OmpR family regulator